MRLASSQRRKVGERGQWVRLASSRRRKRANEDGGCFWHPPGVETRANEGVGYFWRPPGIKTRVDDMSGILLESKRASTRAEEASPRGCVWLPLVSKRGRTRAWMRLAPPGVETKANEGIGGGKRALSTETVPAQCSVSNENANYSANILFRVHPS